MKEVISSTKDEIKVFRDVWNNPSTIIPPRQSKESRSSEMMHIRFNKWGDMLAKAANGNTVFGALLPQYVSTSALGTIDKDGKVDEDPGTYQVTLNFPDDEDDRHLQNAMRWAQGWLDRSGNKE